MLPTMVTLLIFSEMSARPFVPIYSFDRLRMLPISPSPPNRSLNNSTPQVQLSTLQRPAFNYLLQLLVCGVSSRLLHPFSFSLSFRLCVPYPVLTYTPPPCELRPRTKLILNYRRSLSQIPDQSSNHNSLIHGAQQVTMCDDDVKQ